MTAQLSTPVFAPMSAPDLAALWQEALARPMHSSVCGCAVPSAVRLDPQHVELDVLDYVEDKHDLRQYEEWVTARQTREASANSRFADWFLSIGSRQILPAPLWAQVVADVAFVLDSMAAHAANRLAPVSSLQSGWLAGKS